MEANRNYNSSRNHNGFYRGNQLQLQQQQPSFLATNEGMLPPGSLNVHPAYAVSPVIRSPITQQPQHLLPPPPISYHLPTSHYQPQPQPQQQQVTSGLYSPVQSFVSSGSFVPASVASQKQSLLQELHQYHVLYRKGLDKVHKLEQRISNMEQLNAKLQQTNAKLQQDFFYNSKIFNQMKDKIGTLKGQLVKSSTMNSGLMPNTAVVQENQQQQPHHLYPLCDVNNNAHNLQVNPTVSTLLFPRFWHMCKLTILNFNPHLLNIAAL